MQSILEKKKQIKDLSKRTYKNLISGYLKPKIPSYLILYVNNICQLRCDMCFYWDSMQKKTIQLTLPQIEKISKSLPNLFQLTLTGGEPTLNKDLPKIVNIFSKHSNLAKCTIVTNGMLYKRAEEYVSQIVEENPAVDFRLSLSVDAIGELHDKIRGVKGSYDNVIKTFYLLNDLKKKTSNLWVDMNTTISKYNYQEFKNIHKYIKENFEVDNHVIGFVRGETKEKDAKDIPTEFYSEYKKIILNDAGKSGHLLQKATAAVRDVVMNEVDRELKENSHRFDCSAGVKFLEVYQDGKVVPCEILETISSLEDTSMGNLIDFDFNVQKLLKSEKAKKIIKHIKDSKCHCSFECPKHMDALYNKKLYPELLKNLAKHYIFS